MAKNLKQNLKLLVKPVEGKAFGDWDFVWSTTKELNDYNKQGYKRVKKL